RKIKHPNVIRVRDFGESTTGELFLVMELLAGKSLGAVLASGPLSETAAARVAAQAASGLAAAHRNGLIHRDIKPDNLFVRRAPEVETSAPEHTADGEASAPRALQVKVLDFGIAKVVSEAGLTGTDAVLGTARYMPPEQAGGAKEAVTTA